MTGSAPPVFWQTRRCSGIGSRTPSMMTRRCPAKRLASSSAISCAQPPTRSHGFSTPWSSPATRDNARLAAPREHRARAAAGQGAEGQSPHQRSLARQGRGGVGHAAIVGAGAHQSAAPSAWSERDPCQHPNTGLHGHARPDTGRSRPSPGGHPRAGRSENNWRLSGSSTTPRCNTA